MPRSISVFGLGYVGSVTAACLAHRGHSVTGVDVAPAKVQALSSGRSPVLEKGLDALVAEGHETGRLRATTDAVAAVEGSELSLLCVGTPGLNDGRPDLGNIDRVCRQVAAALAQKSSFHLVVLRSTIPPGTAETLAIPTLERHSGRRCGRDFAVCVHPEFTREGSAVRDFFEPAITVLGAAEPDHLSLLREVYAGTPGRRFETSLRVAEMVKYVCNAFHAAKVSFANEMGTLCKRMGIDTEALIEIFTADTRLNVSTAYLSPGFAFGGSCLPKDVRALDSMARALDLRLPLLEALMPSNGEHFERAVELVLATQARKASLLGLSFKPGTDDLRESPLVHLARRLLDKGLDLRIWDPDVSKDRLVGANLRSVEAILPQIGSLLCPTLREALEGADVVLLGTATVTRDRLEGLLHPQQVLVDLVHQRRAERPSVPGRYEGICW